MAPPSHSIWRTPILSGNVLSLSPNFQAVVPTFGRNSARRDAAAGSWESARLAVEWRARRDTSRNFSLGSSSTPPQSHTKGLHDGPMLLERN